jgi:hypothetical protein
MKNDENIVDGCSVCGEEGTSYTNMPCGCLKFCKKVRNLCENQLTTDFLFKILNNYSVYVEVCDENGYWGTM